MISDKPGQDLMLSMTASGGRLSCVVTVPADVSISCCQYSPGPVSCPVSEHEESHDYLQLLRVLSIMEPDTASVMS